jgi:hypothetical protein
VDRGPGVVAAEPGPEQAGSGARAVAAAGGVYRERVGRCQAGARRGAATVEEIARVAATLEEDTGSRKERRARYEKLQREYEAKGGRVLQPLGAVDAELAGGPVPGAPGPEGGEGPAGQPGVGEVVPQAEAPRETDPRPAACGGAYRPGRADPGSGPRCPRHPPRVVRRQPWRVEL